MRTTTLKTVMALALVLLAPPVLQAQTAQAPAGAMTARVIVKFKADSGLLRKQAASAGDRHAAQAQALAARVGFAMSAGRGVGENTQVMFASGMSSAALAERLAKEKDIEYAVPDRREATGNYFVRIGSEEATGGPFLLDSDSDSPVIEQRRQGSWTPCATS